jgi:hypothetical protein
MPQQLVLLFNKRIFLPNGCHPGFKKGLLVLALCGTAPYPAFSVLATVGETLCFAQYTGCKKKKLVFDLISFHCRKQSYLQMAPFYYTDQNKIIIPILCSLVNIRLFLPHDNRAS